MRLLLLLLLLASGALAQVAPYTVDAPTGALVYQLSGAGALVQCAEARHYYSTSVQFSRQGKMVFECDDPANPNLKHYPVYNSDFTLLTASAVRDATGPESGYGEVQFSQVGEWLYGRDGACGVWKFDFTAKTKQLVVRFPYPRCDQMGVGPGDRILMHLKDSSFVLRAVGTFDPATGTSSHMNVTNPPFDQADWTQGSRVVFTFNRQPAIIYTPDLAASVQQEDNHGHAGFFMGTNGQSYKVSVKNDKLPNGGVGQIGCPGVTPWIPEHALYDEATGKRALIFACNWPAGSTEQRSMNHFSRSFAPNVFYGSGSMITRFELLMLNGAPVGVTSRLVTDSKSNLGSCGSYWPHPRAASDWTGTRTMFDSTRLGGCKIQVFVAELAGVSPVPPTPTPTPTPTPVPPIPTVTVSCPAQALASLRCSADVSTLPRGAVSMEIVIRDASGKVIATGKSGAVKLY